MRSADATTLARVGIALLVAYGIFLKINPWILVAGIVFERILDGVDGYLAISEVSKGKIGFMDYVNASILKKDGPIRKKISEYKAQLSKVAPYGARIDIAGDRAVEYIFWIVFTVLTLIPIWVFIIIMLRNTFVDALMGAKGTSSKMRTRFAQIVYSSNLGRGLANIPKILAFSYLCFVYVYAWPLWIGYVLIGILVSSMLLRGFAQLYDILSNSASTG